MKPKEERVIYLFKGFLLLWLAAFPLFCFALTVLLSASP